MHGRDLLAAAAAVGAAALAQPVEVQWWHAMNGVLGERVDELVKKFNESQEKYNVVAANKGNYDEVINGTIAAYRAKRPPQIVQIYERGFMTMLLSDAVVPVQDADGQERHQDRLERFHQAGRGLLPYKGKLAAMPFNSSTPILFYNKDQFQKAGFDKPAETWGEFEKQLYAIKKSGAAECGTALRRDYHWSMIENYSAINDLPYATKSNGYDGLDTEFVYNKTLSSPQVARMKKWLDDGILQIAGQGFSPEQLFTSGKCATYLRLDGGAWRHRAQRQDRAGARPSCRGRRASTPKNSTIGGAALWVIKGHKPEEQQAIAAFFDFLAKPETQLWWHKVTGYVPLTNKAYELAKAQGYYKQSPTREIAVLQLNRGTPTANSLGFHFGNFTQIDVRAARRGRGGVHRQEDAAAGAWTTRSSAATKSCASTSSSTPASTSRYR